MKESVAFSNFFVPGRISEEHVLLTHDKNYYTKLIGLKLNEKELRAIGFPMSIDLIEREKIVQGTIESALNSLKYGVSLNIAGGTHHAFSNRAEAFLYFK